MKLPLRVDFAGGWLDVPRFAIPGAFVVNCAVSPLVRLEHVAFGDHALVMETGHVIPQGAGIGGSAAYRILTGADVDAEEAEQGCGWQDAAVIRQTGLCVWASGSTAHLVHQYDDGWLRGCMALYWTGNSHRSEDIANTRRDYGMIERAGAIACKAVQYQSVSMMADAVVASYQAQRDEGMIQLPNWGIASKYCGAGWGGYAVYMFEDEDQRAKCISEKGLMAIEPYCR